jgi:hypothetical protein
LELVAGATGSAGMPARSKPASAPLRVVPDWAPAARAFHPPQLQTGAVALWRSATGAASELDLLADRVIPCPTAAGRLSSAKLPGDDVIDELRVARPESDPALALDNERGEGTGRELLLEPRQVSTP